MEAEDAAAVALPVVNDSPQPQVLSALGFTNTNSDLYHEDTR